MTDRTLDIRRLDLGGIRTLHVPRAGLTRVTLHFGVGLADEAFSSRGVTHVVEHLAMRVPNQGKFERNASVDRTRTLFWAVGRPDQVAEFLGQLGRGLADLPLEHLEREQGVLEAEHARHGFDGHDALLAQRFGNVGLGLGIYPSLGALATDPGTVREHAARWFVRSNAVLTVLGPLPDDLDLHLRDASTPARSYVDLQRSGPGWTPDEVGDPALGLVGRDVPATMLAVRVMAAALERTLREERGLLYGVEPDLVRMTGTGMAVVQFATATAPGSEKVVAEALVSELLGRLDVGVTAAELADDLEGYDAYLADADSVEADLDRDAERLLAGLPLLPRSDIRAVTGAITADDVATVLQDAVGSAMLIVPTGIEPETSFSRTSGCSVSRQLTTPELRRRFRSSAPRGTLLGYSADVVQFRDEDGEVHEVRFGDCVGVGVTDSGRLLIGSRGCQLWVDPGDFRGADLVVRAVDERVPASLRFSLS